MWGQRSGQSKEFHQQVSIPALYPVTSASEGSSEGFPGQQGREGGGRRGGLRRGAFEVLRLQFRLQFHAEMELPDPQQEQWSGQWEEAPSWEEAGWGPPSQVGLKHEDRP